MDRLKRSKLVTTLLALIFTAAACGPKPPVISYENKNCNDPRILDLEPGDVVDVSDAGGKSDFEITEDGTIFVPDVSDQILDPNAVDYRIGKKDKDHYIVKSTRKGNGDVQITRVCPAPATPTPTPESTPFSFKGPQRLTGINSAFHRGKTMSQAFAQGSHGRIFRG